MYFVRTLSNFGVEEKARQNEGRKERESLIIYFSPYLGCGSNYDAFSRSLILTGFTPLFEWCQEGRTVGVIRPTVFIVCMHVLFFFCCLHFLAQTPLLIFFSVRVLLSNCLFFNARQTRLLCWQFVILRAGLILVERFAQNADAFNLSAHYFFCYSLFLLYFFDK